MASTCSGCVNYIEKSDTEGICAYAPPTPEGEYPLARSEWPRVLATDLCAQFVAGVHGVTTCVNCTNYVALPSTDQGACSNPERPDNINNLCANGKCIAVPPTPVGELRLELSLWPRVMEDDPSCYSCFDAIVL